MLAVVHHLCVFLDKVDQATVIHALVISRLNLLSCLLRGVAHKDDAEASAGSEHWLVLQGG